MIQTIHILHGPNLNLLGRREPDIYGHTPFEVFLEHLRSAYPGIGLPYLQTNHEGRIIDYLHEFGFNPNSGIILNAGGLTHTSISIRDAIAAIETPVVEVHISNIYAREPFRWHSYLTDVCLRQFTGHGLEGYRMAIDYLLSTQG